MEKNELNELKKEVEILNKKLENLQKEAIKLEHLEEHCSSTSVPLLIGIIFLQVLTLMFVIWVIYKG